MNFQNRLLAGLFVVLWSSGYIASKVLLTNLAPFTSGMLRFGLAAMLFLFILGIRRPIWPGWGPVAHSGIVGILMLALQFGGVYAGLKLGASSGFAALVIGSTPLATSLVVAIQGERQKANHWWGLLLGFGGVLLVLSDRLGSGLGSTGAGVALLLGLCGITFGTLYQKRYGGGIDISIGLFVQNFCATIILAPIALLSEPFVLNFDSKAIAALLWLIFINSGLTFSLLFVILRRGAVTSVSALFFLVPPVTALLSWLFLGESLAPLKVIGFGVAAVGVYLGSREFKSQNR